MAGNYPAGVTNQTIDDYFGPDEPEMDEEVITPRDILSRLIQEATGEGRRILQGALEYLWREHRLDSNAEATVALDRFLAGDRAAQRGGAMILGEPLTPLVDMKEEYTHE